MRKHAHRIAKIGVGLAFLLCPIVSMASAMEHPVVIYGGAANELTSASPFTQSADLWVTLPDLTRTTGFVVKPQGVCREESCYPLPKKTRSDFLVSRGSVEWFNLSAFARLLHQAVAHDAQFDTWYFGPQPDAQNAFLSSLDAPNFTLPDSAGKLHSLSDFRGKKVLLITWASW
jgi:hypothetical protein